MSKIRLVRVLSLLELDNFPGGHGRVRRAACEITALPSVGCVGPLWQPDEEAPLCVGCASPASAAPAPADAWPTLGRRLAASQALLGAPALSAWPAELPDASWPTCGHIDARARGHAPLPHPEHHPSELLPLYSQV